MRDYLYILEALKCCRGDRRSNRDFGLADSTICSDRFMALREWADSRLSITNLKSKIRDKELLLRRIWLILIIVASIFGIGASVSLLIYNGSEPVNIFYFLLFSTILPIIGLILTLISIIEMSSYGESVSVDLMPPYWIVSLLKRDREDYKIPSPLFKAYIIYTAQVVSLVFYTAMLLGLIGVIGGKDVAFGWSSTLALSPDELHTIFETIAYPWRDILPSAVPSLSLIEHSHYYRVGEWHPENVSELGEWWRFLAMTLAVYAIAPRVILVPLTYLLYKRVERETILSIDGALEVADEICEPIIKSQAEEQEEILRYDIDKDLSSKAADRVYDVVAGYSIPEGEIKQILSLKGIKTDRLIELGGGRDIKSDMEMISRLKKGKIAIFVKGWEPPTLDLTDIIDTLAQQGMSIYIIPIGFADEGYRCDGGEFEIYRGKIEYLNIKNTEVIKI